VDLVVERDVEVPMRDGTILRANVYRPAGGGPFPVIMERTPYGKDAPRPSAAIDALRAASLGVAVVVQDVRGQGASDGGAFYMFRDEFADGYDSVQWAAAQPFSSGHVGLYGTVPTRRGRPRSPLPPPLARSRRRRRRSTTWRAGRGSRATGS
jgi:predicted acyl esterase